VWLLVENRLVEDKMCNSEFVAGGGSKIIRHRATGTLELDRSNP